MTTTSPRSAELFQHAQESIAGGVTSITRGTTIGWSPYPPFIQRGDGAHLYDVDENEYTDYILGHGPLILGHRPRAVTQAVANAIQEDGALFALPYELEQRVAEKIRTHMPAMELMKFCNSGSEATHYAVRLARAVTGRDKIIKFEGQYHGWTDATGYSYHPALKDLEPRRAPRTIPAAAGTPMEFARLILTQPWNDQETLSKTIRDGAFHFRGESWRAIEIAATHCQVCLPRLFDAGRISRGLPRIYSPGVENLN